MNNKRIATCGGDGIIIIRNVDDTFAINKILQYKCNAIQSILQIKEQEKIISVCQDDKKIQYLIWNITSGQVEMVIGDIKVKLYQWYIRAKGQSIVQLNNERVILSSNNSINMINIKNNNYRFEKQINPKGIDEIKESFLFLELKDGNVLCVYSNTGKAYIYNIQSICLQEINKEIVDIVDLKERLLAIQYDLMPKIASFYVIYDDDWNDWLYSQYHSPNQNIVRKYPLVKADRKQQEKRDKQIQEELKQKEQQS